MARAGREVSGREEGLNRGPKRLNDDRGPAGKGKAWGVLAD